MKLFLSIFAVICYSTMWEIQFHWDRLFAHWFPSGHDGWWNPSISWENKYVDSRFMTFILSTLLVPFTDFFHLLQFIFLNCIFLFVLMISKRMNKWYEYLVALLIINVLWGIIFELTLGIFGALSDKYI